MGRARDKLDHGELVELIQGLFHCGALEPQASDSHPLKATLKTLRKYAKEVYEAEKPDA